jgi:hypothetical protein
LIDNLEEGQAAGAVESGGSGDSTSDSGSGSDGLSGDGDDDDEAIMMMPSSHDDFADVGCKATGTGGRQTTQRKKLRSRASGGYVSRVPTLGALAQAAIATEICDMRNALDLASLADALDAPLLKSYCQQVGLSNMDAALVECGAAVLVDCDHHLLAELEALITPPQALKQVGKGDCTLLPATDSRLSETEIYAGGYTTGEQSAASPQGYTGGYTTGKQSGVASREELRRLRDRWRRRGAWGALPTACWRVGSVGVTHPPDFALFEGEGAAARGSGGVLDEVHHGQTCRGVAGEEGGVGGGGGGSSRADVRSDEAAAAASVGELLARLKVGRGSDGVSTLITGAPRAAALERLTRAGAKKLQQIAFLKDRRAAGETLDAQQLAKVLREPLYLQAVQLLELGQLEGGDAILAAIYPMPYTLYPIPYTLYPSPFTLHPIPYTLYPIPYTLYSIPYTLYSIPYILYLIPYTLYPIP